MTKKECRNILLEARNGLSAEKIRDKSAVICNKIMALNEFKDAKNIFAYAPTGSETDIGQIIDFCFSSGKTIAFPLCISRGHMIFKRCASWDDLVEGRYHILAPKAELPEIDVRDGIMIVPGVGFSRSCDRLGYGGGFYDRYVGAEFSVKYVAAAFECQIMDIPTEEHDQRTDMVITEKNEYIKAV